MWISRTIADLWRERIVPTILRAGEAAEHDAGLMREIGDGARTAARKVENAGLTGEGKVLASEADSAGGPPQRKPGVPAPQSNVPRPPPDDGPPSAVIEKRDRPNAISLSDDELNEVFRQKVYPEIFGDKNLSSVDAPEVLVLGGQPGSGKSFMVPDLLASFEGRGGAVYIGTADTFMKYLPGYDEIVRHDDTATHLLIDDAWKLMSKCVEHATEKRYNVLLEQTLMNPRGSAQMIDRFVEKQYAATVKTLAVPPPESRLSTRTRYMEQRDATGVGLLTPLEIHDAGVSGSEETIRMLQSDNPPVKVHGLAVSSREGDLYHIERDASGEWPEPPRAAEVLETKRGEPLSAGESQSFSDRLGNFRDWVSLQARENPLEAERWERLADDADVIERDAGRWVRGEPPSPAGMSGAVDSGADSPQVDGAGQDSEGR